MARSDVLVSVDWAEENLKTPGVVFVEVDEDTSAYDGGHIEGAVRLDWKKDLQDQVRRDFVNQEQFSDLLSARGISNDDEVVLYGGNNNWFAAYAYWYFKLYGHNNVKLLDGGRKKWELEGRPLSTDAVSRPATQYKAVAPDLTIRAFRDEVIAAIGTKNLVDVRSPDEFSGKILAPAHLPQEQSQRPGHIPSAINVLGARPRTRTAPSSPTPNWPRSTRKPAWTARRKPSPTAGSASVPRTPGSCCRSCSATRMSRTTTGAGPNTAPSSVHLSRWEPDHVRSTYPGSGHSGRCRCREGNGHHRPRPEHRRPAGRRRVRAPAGRQR